MKNSHVHGVIDRRILVNYRVDPSLLRGLLPAPFRPKLVQGVGIAGICLIRLKNVRPGFIPASFGFGSENGAYRIAVEWQEGDQLREGVYIPGRVSASHFNTLVGGRLFPGVHQHVRFEVVETENSFQIKIESEEPKYSIDLEATVATEVPADSIFDSLAAASIFFQNGAVGYSPNSYKGKIEGLELCSYNWKMEPLHVQKLESGFFNDTSIFPVGTAKFDSAFLMRHIEHEWHSRDLAPSYASNTSTPTIDLAQRLACVDSSVSYF
jgi:hypothetical protein